MSEDLALTHDAAPNVVEFRSAAERDQIAEIRMLSSILIERFQFARQNGITFGGKRDFYEIFGFERTLTAADYCDRYARGGLTKKIVDCIPMASWRGEVEVVEDEDPKISTLFEQAADDLNKQLNAHAYLQRADILSQLGYYSILLLGAPGQLNEELPKGKPGQLLYLQPYAGGGGPGVGVGGFNRRTGVGSVAAFGDATIMAFDRDIQSRRFGLPEYYQLRRMDIASDAFTTQVHWSRVIHLADGCIDNDSYGIPSLEAVWNLLDSLDKVTGGGAESYFQKAKSGLHVDINKDMSLPGPPGQGSGLSSPELQKMKNNLEEYKHEMTSLITTRGTTINELGGSPAPFNQEADAIITQIAGTKGIPKRVLTGSEMGTLASTEDRENFRDIVNGRQSSYLGPYVIRRFYDRLIDYGYLPKPKQYTVKFPHIQTLSESEKSTGAKDWATVNRTQGAVVFTEAEIREHWYQMDDLTPEEESQSMTELDKATGAFKWSMTNKNMGVTVFTDDEIRKHWEGMDPLSPDQKLPIAAPERLSGGVAQEPGAPKKLLPAAVGPDGQPIAPPPAAPTPKVAPQSVPQMHAQLPQKPLAAAPAVVTPPAAPIALPRAAGLVHGALETAVAFGRAALSVDELRAAMAAGDIETTASVLRVAAEAVGKSLRDEMPTVLGGPGSGRHKEHDEAFKESPAAGKKLMAQSKREADTASHEAYLATAATEKTDMIAAHQKAMLAHTKAFELNRDVDSRKELTQFHKDKSEQHLDRVIELRKKK